MNLNKRGGRSSKLRKGIVSSLQTLPNARLIQEENLRKKRLLRYFQKRLLLVLAVLIFFFYGNGAKDQNSYLPYHFTYTSPSRMIYSSLTSETNEVPNNVTTIIRSSNASQINNMKSEEDYKKYDTENDAFVLPAASATPMIPTSEPICKIPRIYPQMKYYQLNKSTSQLPSFLTTDAVYIRGQAPFILHPKFKSKICIDSSSWETKEEDRLPFSDGQNPSILSLSSYPHLPHANDEDKSNKSSPRISNSITFTFAKLLKETNQTIESMFASVLYVGAAQCGYSMSPAEKKLYHVSSLDKPPASERALFLLLNKRFDTEFQTPIMLERDQPTWGKVTFRNSNLNDRTMEKLDDPRLFVHNNDLWILYRSGRAFGYEQQVHNKLYFELTNEYDGNNTNTTPHLSVYIKASETITSCCGRNMAMISEKKNKTSSDEELSNTESTAESILKTITWVDPLTVNTVIDPTISNSQNENEQKNEKKKKILKSDIHGTNGYMVPLYASNEYLGIAHFHRPENRDTSSYALHGHHYTHAFFTISMNEPHTLQRISNEFLFESLHRSKEKNDGEVIQFASGLDIITYEHDTSRSNSTDPEVTLIKQDVIVTYGINDCESVAVSLDWEIINLLLIQVEHGAQVLDLMHKSTSLIK